MISMLLHKIQMCYRLVCKMVIGFLKMFKGAGPIKIAKDIAPSWKSQMIDTIAFSNLVYQSPLKSALINFSLLMIATIIACIINTLV